MIGPIDKNINELSAICPELYDKVWNKLYSPETGYQHIYAKKTTKTTKNDPCMYTDIQPSARQLGTTKDIIKHWHKVYKKNGWNRYATYDTTGNFSVPYALLKAKNITAQSERSTKWYKGRPIAPQIKHPMRRLFEKTGRAWSFIASQTKEIGFTLHSSKEVPEFLHDSQIELQRHGNIRMVVKDIEGCFPNMPKEAIKIACRETLQWAARQGRTHVVVPNSKLHRCSWDSKKKYGICTFPLHMLYEVMEFALDNAITKDRHGNLRKQIHGIPMGDPHSPGMTIVTCAWMEKMWMETLSEDTKQFFRAKRYMDDIIFLYATNPRFDVERLMEDFQRSDCYWAPLKLEDGKEDVFLETQIQIQGCTIRHKLKNENADGPKIWRYAHVKSATQFKYKYATLIASLQRVQAMASDDSMLVVSAIDKLKEFILQGYSFNTISRACVHNWRWFLGNKHGSWLKGTFYNEQWHRLKGESGKLHNPA